MITTGRLKSFIVAVWAGFFVWLWLSGQVYRYIGPRTRWVVVFGAVCLVGAALGRAIVNRQAEQERPSRGEAVGLLSMLAPILLVLVIPEPQLGSLAASRKLSGGVVGAALQPAAIQPGNEVSFPEVMYANDSDEYAVAVGIADGYELELTGFVSDAESPPGTFPLTRFSIFCCAADAVPYTVTVSPPKGSEDYDLDTWLRVEGALFKRGDVWVLEAETIEPVDEPQNPYI